MSSMNDAPGLVLPTDVAPQPWANGGGITRVLVERPGWRISVAEIEGCAPFSSLPGVDRILIPLSESGVTLEIEGIERRVPPREAIAFRGEDRVVGDSAGRIWVLNLMAHRSDVRLEVGIGGGVGALVGDVDAVVTLDDRASLAGRQLPPGTVLLPDGSSPPEFSAGAVALVRVSKTEGR